MGAKRITQETFEETVRENMEDFDMGREEAVEDAIQQFQMQGIDLSNIVTSSACADTSSSPVLLASKALSEAVASENCSTGQLLDLVTAVQDAVQCAEDVPEAKVMAGNAGVMPALLSVFNKYSEASELAVGAAKLMLALITKCDINRDHLKEPKEAPRIKALADLLNAQPANADLQQVGFKVVKTAGTKCEAIKAAFMQFDGIRAIKTALEQHPKNGPLVSEVGATIYTVTNADDFSTMLSKVFDTAKELAAAGIMPLLYGAIKTHAESPPVIRDLLAALKGCAIQDDIVKGIFQDGGMDIILSAFKQHIENVGVASRGMLLLSNMAENDDVKKDLCHGEALPLMLTAMQLHSNDALVLRCGFAALASMALRMPDNCHKIMEMGTGTLIVDSMRSHPGAPELNRQAMFAIRNLVVRTKEYCNVFLEEGAEDLIKNARDTHIKCGDAAFDCLRDLGCEYGGLGDQAGKGKNSAYICDDSLSRAGQVSKGSAMVTWEEEES